MLAANTHGQPPLTTTRDLYRELEAVRPDSLRYLLHDLLAANTLWELATEKVTAAPAPGGMTHLTLDVRARKIVVDTMGAEREVPMDDLVEIALPRCPAPPHLTPPPAGRMSSAMTRSRPRAPEERCGTRVRRP